MAHGTSGMISLGVGYYLAVTTESPIQAIFIFLLAVILVMAGTYLLFTVRKHCNPETFAKEQKVLL